MAVYLLHFDSPISDRSTCQHYLGYASDLDARLAEHARGRGARLTAVAVERGIGWKVVKVWKRGTRKLERQLKNQHKHSRWCCVCNAVGKIE